MNRDPIVEEIHQTRQKSFLIQDLMSKALLYAPVFGRGHLGPFQHLEVTELGQEFIRFLEENTAQVP